MASFPDDIRGLQVEHIPQPHDDTIQVLHRSFAVEAIHVNLDQDLLLHMVVGPGLALASLKPLAFQSLRRLIHPASACRALSW
eukprot:7368707-Pyramimonas_sp.AAC.2